MKLTKIITLLILICAPTCVWSESKTELEWIEVAQSELIKARTLIKENKVKEGIWVLNFLLKLFLVGKRKLLEHLE